MCVDYVKRTVDARGRKTMLFISFGSQATVCTLHYITPSPYRKTHTYHVVDIRNLAISSYQNDVRLVIMHTHTHTGELDRRNCVLDFERIKQCAGHCRDSQSLSFPLLVRPWRCINTMHVPR